MLTIKTEPSEFWSEKKGEFVNIPGQTIQMEHSLISISKWEAKWHKPFFDGKDRTRAETLDYFRCMAVTPNVNPLTWMNLSPKMEKLILEYIRDPMTGTTFNDRQKKYGSGKRQIISSEVIYWQLIELGIPFEVEKWHINRLFTLIHVCNVKSQGNKNMSRKDLMAQNRALNAARKGSKKG